MKYYANKNIILTTKHNKSLAIQPYFSEFLSAKVIEYPADTDLLGTFSGEIDRTLTPKECVKMKCQIGMRETGGQYGIANEGSFTPHPYLGFVYTDTEIMVFIDKERDFELYLTKIDTNTNFNAKVISNFNDLLYFAKQAKFPTHGLIIRPNIWNDKGIIFKGITEMEGLNHAFDESIKHSPDKSAWVETDMRANFNPSRMSVIRDLSREMAIRLASSCPECKTPGFGIIKSESGLECSYCGNPTDLIKFLVSGCVKCNYTERHERQDIKLANVEYCGHCNP